MGLIAPAFLAGLMAIAVPVLIHMIHRERRETIAFPSLMFLRKIPYRSVRRQKLRHLLLLALRCLALAIVVAAFARPFFERRIAAAPAVSDAREVVIVLDRSYSMANGARWERALSAIRTIASGIRSTDKLSVVAFGSTAEQVVPPTSDAGRIERTVATLHPGSEPTRVAAGLRMATQILAASELPRREIILVSDFHRFGWSPSDEVPLPERAAIRTVDVSRGEAADVAVAGVAIARARSGDRVRATVTARTTNLGAEPRTVDATLELAGRRVETRRVTVPPRATAQVVFAATPVAAAAVRGVVRITRDSQPSNDAFFFTVAEESGASALIVEPSSARGNQSLFLARAWAVADDPPVRVDVKRADAIGPADLRGRSLVVLNEADLPGGTIGAQIRAQVASGMMLVIVPGERGQIASPEWRSVMPANVAGATDRPSRWASVDFSNALFEPFRSARADFSSVALTRYRMLTPLDSARVIARIDDGSPLLVERPVGNGRVLEWAASFDANWTDLPFHPLWVPFAHQLARRSMAGTEARSWFTAPHVLDLGAERGVTIESPSGQRIRLDNDEGSRRPSVELRERGFYEVRGSATALGAGRPIAVNVDLAESDLSHFDPAELVAAMTSKTAGPSDARPALDGTAQDMERRQSIWWYLLFAALLVLAAETLLSNRLSRRSLDHPAGAS